MAGVDRLIELFTEAKARPAGVERERFLDEHCQGEPELKEQVASLLQAHDGAGDFLNQPALPAEPAMENPGDRIGRYKLLQEIGQGGCGVVYMAEQEEPVRRRVALKVIKLGMDTRQVIARFEAERQALAMMDHPNIAKVFDAGATETGRPFFVMELVRGIRITDYCDQNGLSTAERLALFIPVCQAIQHAHQKGIIHRDIKPANILVTLHDAVPVPKVIDFGIAKATTDQPLTDKTMFTAFEKFIGTPAYMSPEQAQMSGLDIDTRTDIYSLGVLFYELLTGKPPFDPEQLFASGLDEIRRIIREQEPPKPSTRLSTLDQADLSAVAALRHTVPLRLLSLLRGDLDWIVMKCLEKDRSRRYQTASDVAMDLQRFLHSEPVLACPPSAGYRFRKFARRNRTALAIAVALALAALLGLIGLAVTNRLITAEKAEKEIALDRAVKEKARADQNLSRARGAVKEYLLKVSDHPLLKGGDFQGLRRDLLETAVPFYEEFVRQDQEDPDLEFERGCAYDDLGFLRLSLGNPQQAAADFDQAQRVFRRLAASFPERTVFRRRFAEGLNSHANALDQLGQPEGAEREYREALAVLDPIAGGPDAVSEHLESKVRIEGNLGLLLKETGRLGEAEPMLRQAVATREQLVERQPAALPLRGQLAHAWNNLGMLFSAQRRAPEAERAFETGLEVLDPELVKRVAGGEPEPGKFQQQRGQIWNNLGTMRNAAGRFTDAESAFRKSLAIKEQLVETFPSVTQFRHELASSFNNLGTVLEPLERLDEAQAAYERAVQIYERLVADAPAVATHVVSLAGTYTNLGRLLGDRGRLEPSLPWLTKSVEILEEAWRKDPRVVKVRESLCIGCWARAMTLSGLDRYAAAQEDWDRAIEMDDGRYRRQLLVKRASNLLNLKDHVRATADAELLAESPGATAEELYNAACIFALSAQLSADDGPRAESWAARAVALLRLALVKGFKDLSHANSDPDLEVLRSREDFRQFLQELEVESGKG